MNMGVQSIEMAFRTEPFEEFYDIYEELGSGQFAVVRRCCEKSSGVEFAAKFIRKRRVATSRRGQAMCDIEQEVRLLRQMEHPNVVRLHDVFDNDVYVIVVLEYVRGGELFEFVTEKERVSEAEASFFIKQILLGLQHMHSKRIAHLDLKPENVMLLTRASLQIKLIDFGLSRQIDPDEDQRHMLGTPEFVAPEIVNYERLCLACDMWAVGVITFILLSGASPFLGDSQQETFANIVACDYYFDDEFFAGTSESAKDFISRLFVRDPKERATVEDCLNHPWIAPRQDEQQAQLYENQVNIENLKTYQARRRWKHSMRVVSLCNRLSRSAKLRSRSQSLELLDEKSEAGATGAGSVSTPALSPPPTITTAVSQDENFVVSALFGAAEEGNISGLRELFSMANIDPDTTNRHGETALQLAAGRGQLEVVQLLKSRGGDLNRPDGNGDTAAHYASRAGHTEVLEYLAGEGISLNHRNQLGETPLHVACRYGHTAVVQQLVENDVNLDIPDQEGETALHGAAARGYAACVRCLVTAGAPLDAVDAHGATALHAALRRRQEHTAHVLLQAGADCDLLDTSGDAPIHLAAAGGLVTLAQTLCAYGCVVDVMNGDGLYPIHLAAKHGHTEVVRILCLAGCTIDQRNRDGIQAEITAIKHGHNDISQLLSRIGNRELRQEYIDQLIPSSQPIPRVKLKLLGHSGVGKTALVESLKTGYFSSFFKRSKSGSIGSGSSKPSSPHGTGRHCHQLEMTPTRSRRNSLSFDTGYDSYTRGIEITQASVSGVGDLSIWDFSGLDRYYQLYHSFLSDARCLHLVVFRASDPAPIQIMQVSYWLSFLQMRIPPPTGPGGPRGAAKARVALVATHADHVHGARTNHGEMTIPEVENVLQEVRERFGHVFDVHDGAFVLDANSAASPAIKHLKLYLSEARAKVTEGVPRVTGFLEAVLAQLGGWRRLPEYTGCPVTSWPDLLQLARAQVNPLTGFEHLQEVVQQLQLMGEMVLISRPYPDPEPDSDGDPEPDRLVLTPRWLCADILGYMLSNEFTQKARATGCYTIEDFQMAMPEVEAQEMLNILESLRLCTPCYNDGVEYEFPCFNFVETLDGLWEPVSPPVLDSEEPEELMCYGGLRLRTPAGTEFLLGPLFTRIQVELRRFKQRYQAEGTTLGSAALGDVDLYQWSEGSKFCTGQLESMLTLGQSGDELELKLRGPRRHRASCFRLMNRLLHILDSVFTEVSPGLAVERHYLSAGDLRHHAASPIAHTPSELAHALLRGGCHAHLPPDSLHDIVCFGCGATAETLLWLPEVGVAALSPAVRQQLCAALDPPHPLGNDWCLLAVQLGLTGQLDRMDAAGAGSRTARLLDCCAAQQLTVGQLFTALEQLGRDEVAEQLLSTAPVYLLPPETEQQQLVAETVKLQVSHV